MKRRPTEQDQAHDLLEEWASQVERALGSGFNPAPFHPTVQNGRAGESAPERFERTLWRFAELDWAVSRVNDIDPRWKGVLWQQYVTPYLDSAGRPDVQRMAEEMGVTDRTWRRWRKAAKNAFLRAYEGRHEAA